MNFSRIMLYFRFTKHAFHSTDEVVLTGQPTSQSSTWGHGLAEHAVDGDTNGIYGMESCTHTIGSLMLIESLFLNIMYIFIVDIGSSLIILVKHELDLCNFLTNVYIIHLT